MVLPDRTWWGRQMGVEVAALWTADRSARCLTDTEGADWTMIPGRCRGGLDALTQHFGIPVKRGPEERMDWPRSFGLAGEQADLERDEVCILAEIADAPRLGVDEILARAERFAAEGADLIDRGYLPDTRFPQLAQALEYLKEFGDRVSVDSMTPQDRVIGAQVGADSFLSLNETTRWIADEGDAVPRC